MFISCEKISNKNSKIIFFFFYLLIIHCMQISSINFLNHFILFVVSMICSTQHTFIQYQYQCFKIRKFVDTLTSNWKMNRRFEKKNIEIWILQNMKSKNIKKKHRWHFVFDQKKHCFLNVSKIIVVETFNLKKK